MASQPKEFKDVFQVRAYKPTSALMLAKVGNIGDTLPANFRLVALDGYQVKRSIWQWAWDTITGQAPLWNITMVFQETMPMADPEPENWDA